MTDNPAIQPAELRDALRALDDQMTLHDLEPLILVIIGGAAMTLGNYHRRTTIDVDVLDVEGIPDQKRSSRGASPIEFPNSLQQCIRDVAREYDLRDDWLNSGPSFLVPSLPDGFRERADRYEIGDRLTVKVAARSDLILLKTYALVNLLDTPGGNVHREDLKRLDPDPSELRRALEWTRNIYREVGWDNDYLHDVLRELMRSLTGETPGKEFFSSEERP